MQNLTRWFFRVELIDYEAVDFLVHGNSFEEALANGWAKSGSKDAPFHGRRIAYFLYPSPETIAQRRAEELLIP